MSALADFRRWNAQRPCPVNLRALPKKSQDAARVKIAALVAAGTHPVVATEAAFRAELAALGFDPITGRPR